MMFAQNDNGHLRTPDDGTSTVDSDVTLSQHSPGAEEAERVGLTEEPPTARHIVIHRVKCDRTHRYHGTHSVIANYLDVPTLTAGASYATALHGQHHVSEVDNYLADHPELSFMVHLYYRCEEYHEKAKELFTHLPMPSMPDAITSSVRPYFHVLESNGPQAEAFAEFIVPSPALEQAIQALCQQEPKTFSNWDPSQSFSYPYPALYHYSRLFAGSLPQLLAPYHHQHLQALFQYLTRRLSPVYEELKGLSEQGLTNHKYWIMLFRPNDLVVTVQDGHERVLTVKSCELLDKDTLSMKCWSWEYDGKFYQRQDVLQNQWPTNSKHVAITELPIYPLRFAAEGVESRLRDRGHTFWACRRRKFVSYNIPVQGLASKLVRWHTTFRNQYSHL